MLTTLILASQALTTHFTSPHPIRRRLQGISLPFSNPGKRANDWGFNLDQLFEVEHIAGEQLYDIPEDYEYRPHKVSEVEFGQLRKNPALFLRMYTNAKDFIIAWENDEPVPLNDRLIEEKIALQSTGQMPINSGI